MTMTLATQATAPLLRMLNNLKTWLELAEKYAADKGFNPDLWLTSRLAVDMFDLKKQVQLVSDFSKNPVARLLGLEPTALADDEQNLTELKARIEKTIAILQGYEAQAQTDNSWQTREITVPLRAGKTLQFNGLDYLNNFALPAFYFHLMTCYNLLRAGGVPIGKADFYGMKLSD